MTTLLAPSVLAIDLSGGLHKVLKSGVSLIFWVNGTPTGNPGGFCMAYDYINSKLYVYNHASSTWVSVAVT